MTSHKFWRLKHFSHVRWKNNLWLVINNFSLRRRNLWLVINNFSFRRGKNFFQTSFFFQWFIQKIENLKFNIFSPCKMGRNTCKILKIGCFQKKFKIFWKMLRIFWFIQKMKNLKIYIFQYKMGQNTWKFFKNRIFQKCSKLSDLTKKLEIFICVFEIMEKASLTACYFQGNPWKLGASTIQVIGK